MAHPHPSMGGEKPNLPIPFLSKSFSDLVRNHSSFPNPIKSPSYHQGEHAIVFSKEELTKFSKPFKFVLIGKFSKGRPSLEVVRQFFKKIDLKASVNVGLLDYRHILVRFDTEVDYLRMWSRRIWYVQNFVMRVFKWTRDFHVDRESSLAPVWISLPKLPIHFFNKEALFSITSTFGFPLMMDTATAQLSRPSVARIFVEVDLKVQIPNRVWIEGVEESGFWQPIIVENPQKYCSCCLYIGHDESVCRKGQSVNPDLHISKDEKIAEPRPHHQIKQGFRPKKSAAEINRDNLNGNEQNDPKSADSHVLVSETLGKIGNASGEEEECHPKGTHLQQSPEHQLQNQETENNQARLVECGSMTDEQALLKTGGLSIGQEISQLEGSGERLGISPIVEQAGLSDSGVRTNSQGMGLSCDPSATDIPSGVEYPPIIADSSQFVIGLKALEEAGLQVFSLEDGSMQVGEEVFSKKEFGALVQDSIHEAAEQLIEQAAQVIATEEVVASDGSRFELLAPENVPASSFTVPFSEAPQPQDWNRADIEQSSPTSDEISYANAPGMASHSGSHSGPSLAGISYDNGSPHAGVQVAPREHLESFGQQVIVGAAGNVEHVEGQKKVEIFKNHQSINKSGKALKGNGDSLCVSGMGPSSMQMETGSLNYSNCTLMVEGSAQNPEFVLSADRGTQALESSVSMEKQKILQQRETNGIMAEGLQRTDENEQMATSSNGSLEDKNSMFSSTACQVQYVSAAKEVVSNDINHTDKEYVECGKNIPHTHGDDQTVQVNQLDDGSFQIGKTFVSENYLRNSLASSIVEVADKLVEQIAENSNATSLSRFTILNSEASESDPDDGLGMELQQDMQMIIASGGLSPRKHKSFKGVRCESKKELRVSRLQTKRGIFQLRISSTNSM